MMAKLPSTPSGQVLPHKPRSSYGKNTSSVDALLVSLQTQEHVREDQAEAEAAGAVS
jgi:hypothetical protein